MPIIPKYIVRGSEIDNPLEQDKDYINFFHSITHFFAIIVYYARQFRRIKFSSILSRQLLLSRGIIPDPESDPEKNKYIIENYTNEYSVRGTDGIKRIGGAGEVDGELLRLINYNTSNEFVFGLLEVEMVGWCVGSSSPTWTHTCGAKNVVKAFEPTKEVLDLSKYPLSGASYISLFDDNGTSVMKISGHQNSGTPYVGITALLSKKIPVSTKLDYEISFKIKKLDARNVRLFFGVNSFNSNLLQINNQNFNTGAIDNLFCSDSDLAIQDEYYSFRGVLYSSDKDLDATIKPMFRNGKYLRMNNQTNYICPIITVLGLTDVADVLIYDIKVRPVNFNFSQGQLGVKNIIYAILSNNSGLTSQEIDTFIENYLITYKNVLKTNHVGN